MASSSEMTTSSEDEGASELCLPEEAMVPKYYSIYLNLFTAVGNGQLDVVESLLDMGCDINAYDVDRNSLIQIAILTEQEHIVKLLIKRKADLNHKNDVGSTPLLTAVGKHNVGMSRLLLVAGCDVDAQKICGTAGLHIAAMSNKLNMAALLIKSGAKIDIRDNGGETPLFKAYVANNVKMFKYLMKSGADIDAFPHEENLYYNGYCAWKDLCVINKSMYPMIRYSLLHTLRPEIRTFRFSRAEFRQFHDETMKVNYCRLSEGSEMSLREFLLEVDEDKVCSILKNIEVGSLSDLKARSNESYPIYAKMIIQQFIKGKKRLGLLQKSSIVIAHSDLQELPELVLIKITKLLSNQHLKSLITAAFC